MVSFEATTHLKTGGHSDAEACNIRRFSRNHVGDIIQVGENNARIRM